MRKIIMAVIAALVALFGLFGVQIGLIAEIDPANIIAALLILGVWIFTEFKRDWAEFKNQVQQTNKWSDPSFWTAAITSVLLPLLMVFGVEVGENIVAIAASILAIVIPLLVKARQTT